MFNNKKDVLLESVKKVMQESELHRKLEAELNEAYGIASRAALPHEYVAEYDAILDEAKKTGSLPTNAKESQLAALAPPRTHVTHKDVLKGRGVIGEDEQEIKNKRMKLRDKMADPWEKRPSNQAAKKELEQMFGTKNLLNKLAYPKKLEEASLAAREKVLARSKMRSQEERKKLGPDASSLMGTKEGEAYTQASAAQARAERGVMRRKDPAFGLKEDLKAIQEEIRNSLWEKLDYVYENYGEEAAMEMYASLTEEEQQILEFLNDPNSQWNRLTKPALNKAWNWAKDNASSIASTVTKAIPGANAIEPGIQAVKAIGNAASSARAGLQNAARNGPQVTAARQQNYRAAHNTPEPTTGTGEPNRSPAPAKTAASPPGAGTEHTPAAAPRSPGMLDADRQAQQRAWGVKAGSPRNDGVEADQTLGGPSKPDAPAPAATPARTAPAPTPRQTTPRPAPSSAPSSSGGSSGGQPEWARKAFNPDTGA